MVIIEALTVKGCQTMQIIPKQIFNYMEDVTMKVEQKKKTTKKQVKVWIVSHVSTAVCLCSLEDI